MRLTQWIWTGLMTAMLLGPAATVEAGIGQNLIRGMNLADFRFSGEQNPLGDGMTINAVANWNNREFDFGNTELTLTGGLLLSAGYTQRGIPEFEFNMSSFNTPISYVLDMDTGFQNLTATGGFLVTVDTKINALGFYDQTYHLSNRGTFELDGIAQTTPETLDYDIGPINVSGNVFADAVAALTQPFFSAAGTENPFAKISNRAVKQAKALATRDQLLARLETGAILSDQEIATLVNNSILSAMLGGQPGNDLFTELIMPAGLLDNGPFELSNTAVLGATVQAAPEPGTLGLLALGLLLLPACRRSWR